VWPVVSGPFDGLLVALYFCLDGCSVFTALEDGGPAVFKVVALLPVSKVWVSRVVGILLILFSFGFIGPWVNPLLWFSPFKGNKRISLK
jgi:hypothetical protein